MSLTAAQIMTLTKRGRYLISSPGLYLVVTMPTRRHWEYRYTVEGRERVMSLGPVGPVTLAGARALHLQARNLRALGKDPLNERKQAKAARRAPAPSPGTPTFTVVAQAYLDAHSPAWRNQHHRRQWQRALHEIAGPVIGGLPVDRISTDDVLSVLQSIWHKTPASAAKLRGKLEAVFNYARVRHWREGSNPATWRGNLSFLLPSPSKLRPVKHHASLPWKEAPAFMRELMATPNGMGAIALAFAILTAARSGEVRGAVWSEIDFAERLWCVPGARMKGQRLHRVPLSDAALALLQPLAKARQGALVFPGAISVEQPLSDMTLTAVLRRMGRGDLTAHGFRSTFRSWAQDNNQNADAAELSLAHWPGTQVQQAYQRSDMVSVRRQMMSDWSKFLFPSQALWLPEAAE